MAIHRTQSGFVELIHSWGHGRGGNGASFYRRPAILVFDDGDGHYTAWKVEGSFRDAAKTLGQLHTQRHSDCIVTLDGSSATVERAADDFWIGIEIEGEIDHFEPNLAAYPNVVAY